MEFESKKKLYEGKNYLVKDCYDYYGYDEEKIKLISIHI